MSAQAKMWVQIAGAGLLGLLALAQGTGAMRPAFDSPMWIAVLAFAAAYMLFEAWRTRRKMSLETKEK